jgi:4-amino-4-deoxy-L-arabinose transferase-like glycosyltransferase
MLKKLWSWIEKNEGLVWLLLLVVLLRIPSLYEPYWYGDEGIYLTLGQALKKGWVFYRDIHDNKPPLLYLVAALAGNVYWFRAILALWFAATATVFFRLMQVLLPKEKWAWYVSTLAMIIGTTMLEGNVANGEIFMIGPVTAAVLLLVTAIKKKKPGGNYFLAGILLSLGFLFKVPAGFDLASLLLWLLIFEQKNLKAVLKIWKDRRLWLVLGGFLLPVGLSVAYYAKVGGLEPYVRSALMQNVGYLSSWGGNQMGLLVRSGVLLVSLAIFYGMVREFKLGSAAKLAVIWFLLALFAALLSERPYPHYLIQPAVPAAILISLLLFSKRKIVKLVVLTTGFLAGLAYYQIRFWRYPIVAYYQNFIQYSLGKKSQVAYNNFFDWRVNQTNEVAKYLRETTLPEERIFIWGDEPYIYALARRLPIGRYTVAYHVVDFNGWEETIEAWDKYQPKIVVVMSYEKRKFPAMEKRLATDYMLVKQIDKALIYRRIGDLR